MFEPRSSSAAEARLYGCPTWINPRNLSMQSKARHLRLGRRPIDAGFALGRRSGWPLDGVGRARSRGDLRLVG